MPRDIYSYRVVFSRDDGQGFSSVEVTLTRRELNDLAEALALARAKELYPGFKEGDFNITVSLLPPEVLK